MGSRARGDQGGSRSVASDSRAAVLGAPAPCRGPPTYLDCHLMGNEPGKWVQVRGRGAGEMGAGEGEGEGRAIGCR
jgi:hypothetical protein